jgi:hypothetical protein
VLVLGFDGCWFYGFSRVLACRRFFGHAGFAVLNRRPENARNPRPKLEPAKPKREAGSGKREAGSWKLEAGSWKLEAGSWKLT